MFASMKRTSTICLTCLPFESVSLHDALKAFLLGAALDGNAGCAHQRRGVKDLPQNIICCWLCVHRSHGAAAPAASAPSPRRARADATASYTLQHTQHRPPQEAVAV